MCPELIKLCESLKPLLEAAASTDDLVERIRINGKQYTNAQEHLADLLSIQQQYGLDGITVRINDEAADVQGFSERVESGEPIRKWQVLISKKSVSDQLLPDDQVTTIWFLSQAGFEKWVSRLDPFGSSSKELRDRQASRILVCGAGYAFGGPSLAVADINGSKIPNGWPQQYEGPSEGAIKQQVHLLASESTALVPSPFLLSWGDIDSEVAKAFRMLSAQMLCACLSQEFYGHERVVLKGARRLELALAKDTDAAPSEKQLAAIWSAVCWIYVERSEIRAVLIADRLTLDLANGQSLVAGASQYIEDALKQSKDQYKFVIRERKDAYAKELRELLKDVQQQAGLFSEKIRSILNGLLRDVLAALLLISLGLFSRIGKTQEVLASKEADLLFKALSAYLIISLVLQLLIHLRDIYLSREELRYWTNAARNQLGMKDIDRHLEKPIRKRKCSFYVMVVILSLVYGLMAFIAWNFQGIAKAFGILH